MSGVDFIQDLGLVMLVAAAAAWLCQRIGVPVVIGYITAGILIGAAQAGTTYAVIYGVIGRNIDPAKRSWARGVAAAAGSCDGAT